MIYKAYRVFTGAEMLYNAAVCVKDGLIEAVLPYGQLPANAAVTDLGDVLLAPAFTDVQIYGAYKRLLSALPDAETVAAIAAYSRAGGAATCLPTVATHTYGVIFQCVDAVKDYWEQGGKGVAGLHVEGPWINPLKRGAHREEWIFSPSPEQARVLLDYGKGVIKMITLAPEVVQPDVIKLVRDYGVVISAGHSNASYEQATLAFDNGIHVATHLYNAMSPLQHRAPGLVGAIFNHPEVLCSLVADGHHVDYAAIRIAKTIMGSRLFAITDAVTETTEGYYQHHPEGEMYTSNGVLSGSALTMHKAFYNLVKHCHISIEEALRMCSLYPAMALNRAEETGMLRANAQAEMIVLNNDLSLRELIVQ